MPEFEYKVEVRTHEKDPWISWRRSVPGDRFAASEWDTQEAVDRYEKLLEKSAQGYRYLEHQVLRRVKATHPDVVKSHVWLADA